MPHKITVDALLQDLQMSGPYALTSLVNAYLGDQPVTAQVLKNNSSVHQYVNNNGQLMPLTKAAVAALLEQPEWAEHPVVQAAVALRKVPEAEMTADERMVSHAMNDITYFHRHSGDTEYSRAIWLSVYTGQSIPPSTRATAGAFYREYVVDGHLVPVARMAAERLIAEGKAPSREILGLTPVYEVRIQFPTAAAATAFLARWKDDIGHRLYAATQRLLGGRP